MTKLRLSFLRMQESPQKKSCYYSALSVKVHKRITFHKIETADCNILLRKLKNPDRFLSNVYNINFCLSQSDGLRREPFPFCALKK